MQTWENDANTGATSGSGRAWVAGRVTSLVAERIDVVRKSPREFPHTETRDASLVAIRKGAANAARSPALERTPPLVRRQRVMAGERGEGVQTRPA